jgi:hypothetical protein
MHLTQHSPVRKWVILGIGEVGRATLFKQFQVLGGDPLEPREIEIYSRQIRECVIRAVQILIKAAIRFFPLECAQQPLFQPILELGDDEPLGKHRALLKNVWALPVIQKVYTYRNYFQLFESAKYLLDKIDDIARDDYAAPIQDILHVRIRTTGLVNSRFLGCNEVYYAGGQRNERKKWIHMFQNVDVLTYDG